MYSTLSLSRLSLVLLITILWLSDLSFTKVGWIASRYIIVKIPKGKKIIDLSADFRLSNGKLWQETYDSKHRADDLLAQAIYGLPEHSAEKIKEANLVAVPGCYPTASILGLLPVIPYLQQNSKIILDAKSGISGAGKSSVENGLEEDIKENFKSYKRKR